MPSRLRQHVIIIPGRRRNNGTRPPDIILIERTGYLNLTVNGHHFYYNYSESHQMGEKIDIEKIILQQKQKQDSKRKQTILITKKGG